MEEDSMMQEGQELPELEEYTEEQESAPEEPQSEQDEARDAAGADAQEDAQELPELEPPQEAQTHQPQEDSAAPDPMSEAMALLGVDNAAAAMERIEQIAVNQLMEQGAPKAIAREMVAMRRRMHGGAVSYRARDEPAHTAPQTQPAPETQRPNMDKLAKQIEYIRDKTGVDMLEVAKADPAMLAEIDKFSRGQGGHDMMTAYNNYRRARSAGRAKVPATVGHGGGQTGAGKLDVGKMSAAKLEELERRALQGENIAL